MDHDMFVSLIPVNLLVIDILNTEYVIFDRFHRTI